jgi:hypothetical protein
VLDFVSSGDYVLFVRVPGYRVSATPFTVGEGKREEIYHELRLEPSATRLEIGLIDRETGAPVAPQRQRVSLVARDTQLSYRPECRPGPDGSDRLVWDGLPLGVYGFAVAGQGRGFGYGEVRITEENPVLQKVVDVPPAGQLCVQVRDAGGRRFTEPLPIVVLERLDGPPACRQVRSELGFFERSTDAGGGVCFAPVNLGHYRVTVSREGFVAREDTHVYVGDDSASATISIERLRYRR